MSLANPTIVKSETLHNVDDVVDLGMKIAEETTELKDLDLDGALKKMKKDKIGVQGAKIKDECGHHTQKAQIK